MKRFKKLLMVCDFDTKQHMEVERTVSLAQQNKAKLTVISVVKEIPANMSMAITAITPPEVFQLVIDDKQKRVDALVADVRKQGVQADSVVITGTPCPCPVWVVKPAKRTKYKKIMAAVDISRDFPDVERNSLNPLILQLAGSLAQMDDSRLHVVQVWSVYGEGYMQARGNLTDESLDKIRTQNKQEYASRIDSLLASIDLKGVISRRHLPRSERVAKTIVKLAKNKAVDLLVMGTVCRTGLPGFIIGNTAEKVLSEVNCSVLTVKPEGFVTPVTLEDA